MTRLTQITLVSAAALSLLTGAALASGQAGDRPEFSALDLDQNGEISLEEMQTHRATRFSAGDTNQDGRLDRAELLARSEARAADRVDRMISRLDSNDDGALSVEELSARRDPARMFNRIDSDGSGGISQAEFDAAADKMRDRMAKRRAQSEAVD